ncbi:glycosyl transferase family 90 [Nonlabens ponticola]|uniref:Lipopolysaccharide biosynthesis protein n=1 Tax=Nonlabens ponticola TaxID=2496866 RepID=A0A3S9N0D4_9FLAO|nr:glycosyl transferase family 90 [Nonlabens ponticola]AZQ44773.1 lipopolysaccharide biosynthesis protein [Nonlabens ponticola]
MNIVSLKIMLGDLDRLSGKYKQSKLRYYISAYAQEWLPDFSRRKSFQVIFDSLDQTTQQQVLARINYYNKLDQPRELINPISIADYSRPKKQKVYYFDLKKHLKTFDPNLEFLVEPGDVTTVPDQASFVKTRPIQVPHENSVLMKLNAVRHFNFVDSDRKSFTQKQDRLVWRGKMRAAQPHRVQFVQQYFDSPLCDIGKVNKTADFEEFLKPRMTIEQQLDYKFILCIEGNDVATNLKWVMSSNSIAVMPKPKYESWFMEGTLIPDHHYILINDDYSNLNERLQSFIDHADKAAQLIKNAHEHVRQFQDRKLEQLIQLGVVNKYFEKTGQSQS